MSADKSGSPPCGIYVRIDDFSNMLDLIGYVRQMAFTINQRSGYEKNMSVVEVAYTPENAERAKDIIPIIQDQGLVAIIQGAFDPYGADGVLLDDVADIAKARAAQGEDAIIGVACKTVPNAIEGADYIILNADPNAIVKCKASHDVLCVARSKKGVTPDSCGALINGGADFVDVSTYILKHKKGVMQGTVNILHEIEKGLESPKALN
jgi:hypothetical protein